MSHPISLSRPVEPEPAALADAARVLASAIITTTGTITTPTAGTG